jgi:hypothetical protein
VSAQETRASIPQKLTPHPRRRPHASDAFQENEPLLQVNPTILQQEADRKMSRR